MLHFNLLASFAQKAYFFKDYGIIWEAAYRISLGQFPFLDFSSPVGPGSFLIPALIFKLFGPSWINLQLCQLAQSALLLFSGYYILDKNKVRGWSLSVSITLFTLFYLIFLSHPWYNITATLFFLLSLVVILTQCRYSFFIAGLLSGLSFLTKQDIGLINLISLCLISIFTTQNFNIRLSKITDSIYCVSGMFVVIILFATYVGYDQLSEWILISITNATQRGNGIPELLNGLPLIALSFFALDIF